MEAVELLKPEISCKLGINSTAMDGKSPKPVAQQEMKAKYQFGDMIFGCLVNQLISSKILNSHEFCFLKNLSNSVIRNLLIHARFKKTTPFGQEDLC